MIKESPYYVHNRNTNIELYRIVVMFFIVAHHYVINSGLIQVIENEPLTGKSAFFYVFGMWGKTGINCFVLITGYFMCRSNITLRKFLKLFIQIEFYNIVINLIFIFTGYKDFNIKSLYEMIWPIRSVSNNFISCFLIFYLFIPFFNILIHNMNKKHHQLLLVLCLFIYTILGTSIKIPVTMNYVTWFSILYLVSSYIRTYGINYKGVKIKWGWLSLISIVISAISVLLLSTIVNTPWLEFVFVSDSNHILAVITSICLFMYFKELPIKNSRFINRVASCMFGVLLIHANSNTMCQWLWHYTLDNVGWYATDYAVLHALICVTVIFIICIIIYFLRQKFFEKPFFNKFIVQ